MSTDIEKRISDLETNVLQLMVEKDKSRFKWIPAWFIPCVIGVMIGLLIANFPTLTTHHSPLTTLEQQAATGGAAIPFLKESHLPSLLNSPPGDSKTESADSSSMSISEPPLPNSRQADNGQANSQKLFRLRLLRIR